MLGCAGRAAASRLHRPFDAYGRRRILEVRGIPSRHLGILSSVVSGLGVPSVGMPCTGPGPEGFCPSVFVDVSGFVFLISFLLTFWFDLLGRSCVFLFVICGVGRAGPVQGFFVLYLIGLLARISNVRGHFLAAFLKAFCVSPHFRGRHGCCNLALLRGFMF